IFNSRACRSFMVTARISGLSLAPLHTLHGSYVMNDRMRLRVNSLSVCSYSRCIWGTIVAEIHLDRRSIGAEVKRLLELVRQFAERHVFIDVKVLHERPLQVPIVCLHSLRPTPPRYDSAFSQCFARIGNHKLGIANQLGAKSVTSRACSEVAVEGKMSRS